MGEKSWNIVVVLNWHATYFRKNEEVDDDNVYVCYVLQCSFVGRNLS